MRPSPAVAAPIWFLGPGMLVRVAQVSVGVPVLTVGVMVGVPGVLGDWVMLPMLAEGDVEPLSWTASRRIRPSPPVPPPLPLPPPAPPIACTRLTPIVSEPARNRTAPPAPPPAPENPVAWPAVPCARTIPFGSTTIVGATTTTAPPPGEPAGEPPVQVAPPPPPPKKIVVSSALPIVWPPWALPHCEPPPAVP